MGGGLVKMLTKESDLGGRVGRKGKEEQQRWWRTGPACRVIAGTGLEEGRKEATVVEGALSLS